MSLRADFNDLEIDFNDPSVDFNAHVWNRPRVIKGGGTSSIGYRSEKAYTSYDVTHNKRKLALAIEEIEAEKDRKKKKRLKELVAELALQAYVTAYLAGEIEPTDNKLFTKYTEVKGLPDGREIDFVAFSQNINNLKSLVSLIDKRAKERAEDEVIIMMLLQ